MIRKSFVAAGLAAIVLALSMQAPLAQDASSAPSAAASSAPAAPEAGAPTRTANENWLKVCSPLKDGNRACVMRQVVVTPDGHFIGSFLLRDDPGEQSRLLAVAAVPLGVLIPFRLYWQIDNNKPMPVPYYICDQQACATQLPVNEAFVNSLKKGSQLTLTAKDPANKPLVVTINLAGFTSIYDGDAALSFDEFNKNTTGDGALQKILQDRAAAAAAEKTDGASSAPPAQ